MLVRIPSNKTKNCYWIFDGSNARQKAFVGIIFISKFELLELKGSPAWNDELMFLTEAKLLLLFIYFLEVHIHKKWNSNNEKCWNWLSVILHPLGQFHYRYQVQVQVNFMGFNTQNWERQSVILSSYLHWQLCKFKTKIFISTYLYYIMIE